jgi:hypothetical protein
MMKQGEREKEMFEQIRKWHVEERQTTLKRTFSLGDMINKAIVMAGISEYEVIKIIMEQLGDLALGQTSYNRAARMARTFTAHQRRVLIDKLVSLDKCEILAGKMYDKDRRRVNAIHAIKTGKIQAPWAEIKGAKETERINTKPAQHRAEITEATNPDKNPDFVSGFRLYDCGELNMDALVDHVTFLLSRLDKDIFVRALNVAQQRTRKKILNDERSE